MGNSRTGGVLVVAAHPDDEVLGCGGTIARMAAEGHRVHVLLLADGESSRSTASRTPLVASSIDQRNEAARAANKILGTDTLECLGLPDNRLDSIDLLDITKRIEATIARYRPSMVFTHHVGDVNIDHRITHDAVITACRPQPDFSVRELLFFEVPSSTEWRPTGSAEIFAPNWFVDISSSLGRKLEALQAYSAELRNFPHPRSLHAIESLAAWRGACVGVTAAEGFALGRHIS